MYDIEILVPAEGKLIERFENFRKWGIRNIGKHKVKLVLAASCDNEISMFEGGWPTGLDVEVCITPYKHVAQRIYHYYNSIIKPDTAKWYFRIDEDSMNDISGLMENLELLFDHEREYHITGEVNWDVQTLEKSILTQLGFDDWYKTHGNNPPHEFESSITSNAAMKRILSNEKAQKYFKIRKEIANGYGDHGLCFCARMEKIHPTIVSFITVKPEIFEFSEFKGKFNHIHWISEEDNPGIVNWLNSMSPENEKSQLNSCFAMSLDGNKTWIKLDKNNIIEEISNKKIIGLWSVNKNNELTFFFREKKSLMVFDATNELDNITTYNCKNKNCVLKTGDFSTLVNLAF